MSVGTARRILLIVMALENNTYQDSRKNCS